MNTTSSKAIPLSMITMIRKLSRNGKSISQIERITGVSARSVWKYTQSSDKGGSDGGIHGDERTVR